MVDRGQDDLPGDLDERTLNQLEPVLRRLESLTAPDDDACERMRRTVLAGLAEDAGSIDVGMPRQRRAPAPSPRPRPRPDRPAGRGPTGAPDTRPATSARQRFAIAALAGLALVFSLAGMSLMLSRDALPGDPLYGIKRTAEAASLGLTFSDEAKALKHLEFASARVTEIETLTQRHPNPDDVPAGGYLTALRDFDTDAAAGSRQLIDLATSSDGRQLAWLAAWSDQQEGRLTAVEHRLPAAAANRQQATLALLDKMAARAAALQDRMPCYEITSGSSDEIGALPDSGICQRVPVAGSPGDRVPDTGAPPPVDGSTETPVEPPEGADRRPGDPSPTPTQPVPTPPEVDVIPPRDNGPLLPDPRLPETEEPSLELPLPTVELPPLLPGILGGIGIGTPQ